MILMSTLEMLSVMGKSCAVRVAGIALGLLAVGVITGGAGWVIAGAYTPVARAFCAN